MSQIYYNPDIFTPKKHLEWIKAADLTDRFTEFRLRTRKPYATREDALKESLWGNVYFYENGVVYSATLVPEWAYKPCVELQCECGINWNTYYATNRNTLKTYLSDHGADCEWFDSVVRHDPKLGTYSVQVHYDGRIR